jgi:hypothetical protein
VNRWFLNMGIPCLLLTVGLSASWSQTVGSIEFENDALMVVRVHMAPGEKTPMHDIDSRRLVIWLTDALERTEKSANTSGLPARWIGSRRADTWVRI